MALLTGLLHTLGLYDSPERKLADQDRREALGAATDQADVLKKLILSNQGIADDLDASIFGESQDQIAQNLANKRAELEGQGNGTSVVSYGTDGKPVYGGAPASAKPASTQQAQKLMPGWSMPTPPPPGGSGKYRVNGQDVGYDEYLKIWQDQQKQLNPENRPLVVDQKTGQMRPVNDAEIAKAQELGYGTGTDQGFTPKTPNAPITDADRQEAQRRYEANYANTVPGQLDASQKVRQSAADKFKAALDGIDRVNPGEYQNSWDVQTKKSDYLSPEARAAQQTAMGKTLALTDTKETAEEKLMREISRRNQERDLRAQREAQADQLRSRGAYGSGAELSGFLGAQQDLAQRRSMEELGADANAQKRATDALTAYGNQAFQLGTQDANTQGMMDLNSRFNSGQRQQFKEFKTKTEQEENRSLSQREASKLDATNQTEDANRGNIDRVTNLKTQIAGLKTGNNTTAANFGNDATKLISGAFGSSAADHSAKADKDEDILSF